VNILKELAIALSGPFTVHKQRTAFLLCLLTAAPFVPGAFEFGRRGIPDQLFAGDAATLELGTWHAARGQQLLGPYSRFGWNHPGPAFFYLAAPMYELFNERGPALSLFAFCADFVSAVAIVFTAYRLNGRLFAVVVAVLLGVLELVALPFLLANEWNPVFPILPFVLFCLLAARIATGAAAQLPALAFIGSVIVQTHVAYALEVIALSVYAVARRPRSGAVEPRARWIMPVTLGTVTICWALPVAETLMTPPGNLQRLLWFFWPIRTDFTPQAWSATFATIVRQMSAVPWAVAQTITQRRLPEPGIFSAVLIAGAELLCLAAAVRHTQRNQDVGRRRLAEIVLLATSIAVLSVRAIRGDILLYLVSWCSVIGLLSVAVITASALDWVQPRIGVDKTFAIAVVSGCVLLGLAWAAPVRRPSVIHGSTAEVDHIAPIVNAFMRTQENLPATVFLLSRESWPIAVGVVLYMCKHDTPIAVEEEWIGLVGRPLGQTPGQHPGLFFANDVVAQRLRPEDGFVEIASARDVHVLFRPMSK
jgi:hypothetical protein